MTTPDPTTVRNDAKLFLEDCHQTNALVYGNMQRAANACRDYLALTDPTPLSVEVLVGMGVNVNTHKDGGTFLHGVVGVYWGENHDRMEFRIRGNWLMPIEMWPRTAGELRQLLGRIGER